MDSHVNNGAHLRIMELIWASWKICVGLWNSRKDHFSFFCMYRYFDVHLGHHSEEFGGFLAFVGVGLYPVCEFLSALLE
jgi:hypothetical protein